MSYCTAPAGAGAGNPNPLRRVARRRVYPIGKQTGTVISTIRPPVRSSAAKSRSVARSTSDSVASVDLQRRIAALQGEFLLFALTPPRLSTTQEKAQEIADITFERLEPLDVDGLIL